jgi:hypothetical protein
MKLVLPVLALVVGGARANAASPPVSACVLDGGGTTEERACGIERATFMIGQTYKFLGANTKFQILTGEGVPGKTSCRTPLTECRNAKDAGSCGPGIVMQQQYDAKVGIVETPVMVDHKLGLTNPPWPISSATSDSFDRNCLFDSSHPPSPPLPVCNFWNLNHGGVNGSEFYQPSGGTAARSPAASQALDADRLATKAAGCSTFRFVTQACYGAQLSRVIYGKDGRVVEGRCGMSSAPPGYHRPMASRASKATARPRAYGCPGP